MDQASLNGQSEIVFKEEMGSSPGLIALHPVFIDIVSHGLFGGDEQSSLLNNIPRRETVPATKEILLGVAVSFAPLLASAMQITSYQCLGGQPYHSH
jgi:hypothetical protein